MYLCERAHLCVIVTATVTHACPQAGHKSSLEMVGKCVVVCAQTIDFNGQQAVIQLPHSHSFTLFFFFQASRNWYGLKTTHTHAVICTKKRTIP